MGSTSDDRPARWSLVREFFDKMTKIRSPAGVWFLPCRVGGSPGGRLPGARAARPAGAGPQALAARRLVFAALVLALAGCAGTGTGPDYDPYEATNRSVHAFNKAVDAAAIKPVAVAYRTVTPAFLDQMSTNFFGNLQDVGSTVNSALQLKTTGTIEGMARVSINSTLGLAGLIDIATGMGLELHDEDFGQTLGVWGVGPGVYVVLPLLGPSSVRDAFGTVVDVFTDPLSYGQGVPEYAARGVRLIDKRADLLEADRILGTAALDEYRYVRDAYRQRRLSQVHDGNPPRHDPDPPDEE